MVGHRACHELGEGDAREVDRRSQDGHRSRPAQAVAGEDLKELGVQRRREIGAVGIPGEDVEGRRLLAHEVVVHPVLEDQVIWPHPGENAAHRAGRDHSFALRITPGEVQDGPRREGADGRRNAEVQQRHGVRHGTDPPIPLLGKVVQDRGGDQSSGTEAHNVDVFGLSDLADCVDRVQDGGGVVGHVPRALLR